MRKWGIILAGAMVIAASTLVLAQGGEDEGEPQDIMKTLCKDAECTSVFWEDPLDFEEFFATDMDCDEEEEAPGGGSALDWSGEDYRNCEYVAGGGIPYIQCTVDTGHTGVGVGLAAWLTDEGEKVVLMCYNDGGTYSVGGWAIVGYATALYVDGSSSGDNIGIIKYDNTYSADCDFEDFPSTFNDDLEIDGLAGTDTIGGSQWNDSFLQGESVSGYANNDTIYIFNGSPRQAWGGRGQDEIHGSAGADSIWGDDASDTVGNDDTIFGDNSADQIAGLFGQDTIDGGWGNDTIWGYTGADSINGQGDTDVCYGGTDSDYCVCETEYDCET
jgi:Ca2+-binding RTX toxin-like protein